jgi:PAS domain S-box-containing protein
MSFAASVGAFAELKMARAATPDVFQAYVTLNNVAVCVILVSLVWFVRLRMKSGRHWMAVTISALWITGIVIDFLQPGSLTFSIVHALELTTTFWGEPYVVADTSQNPFKILVDVATILIVIIAADAAISRYRAERRPKAYLPIVLILGGVLAALVHSLLIDAGILRMPSMISVWFVAIMLTLTLSLVDDVAKVPTLTRGLVAQERRWEALLDGMQLAVLRSDRNGRAVYLNPHLRGLLGSNSDNLIGQSLSNPTVDGSWRDLSIVLNDMKEPSDGSRASGQFEIATGELRDFEWFSVKQFSDHGTYDGSVYFGEDVTERQQARMELSQTRRDIEKLTRGLMLGELTASIVHELRQPLAAILSNVQAGQAIRKSGEKVPNEIDEVLDAILAATRRARDIIDKIRGFVLNKPPEKEPFEFTGAVEEIVDIFDHDATARQIKINMPKSSPITVLGSRIELQQIIMNVILNSIEAMKSSPPQTRRIDIDLRQDGRTVELVIDDTGPGVPRDIEDHVLSPFVSTKREGTGIGLAVSRRIAQRHDGTIEFDTSPLGGARCRIALPIAEDAGLAVRA